MSKKRMSAAEKKAMVLQTILDANEPMSLAEIEDAASKAGVVRNLIKDIVTELTNEGSLSSEKIGLSPVWWAFAGAAAQKKQEKLAGLEKLVEQGTAAVDKLIAQRSEETQGREETEERTLKLERLAALKKDIAALQAELPKYAENDPALIQAMIDDAIVATEAANRWTDNIMNVRSYARDNFGTSEQEFNRQFGISDSFDTFPMPKFTPST